MSTTVENIVKDDATGFPITIALPNLNPGERLVATIISPDGKYRHHLILLPEEAEENTWQAQMDWAASLGGDLPDRVESALLFATLRDEFKPDWHWTNEQHATNAGWAWVQGCGDGSQSGNHKDNDYRARAVRRIKI
jgi:hypothetical protein